MKKPSRFSLLWKFLKTRDSFYWFMLLNYGHWGFTELTYRGVPFVRDDRPREPTQKEIDGLSSYAKKDLETYRREARETKMALNQQSQKGKSVKL